MKITLVIRVLVCVAVIAIAQFGSAPAQSAEPKTVADFFRLVPKRYMEGYDFRFREQLLRGERRGTVVDIRNGYISWDASDNPEEFEFAIFRKSNGKYLVAFSVAYNADFDYSHFYLLSYDNGRWRDVTRRLLPVRYNRTHTYKLPRHGRTIVVTGEDYRTVYSLRWLNDRFRLNRFNRE